jgi:hypothetical protein
MAVIAKPVLKRKSAKTREPVTPAQRRRQQREEIIGLIGFGAVMLFVVLMRNYAY